MSRRSQIVRTQNQPRGPSAPRGADDCGATVLCYTTDGDSVGGDAPIIDVGPITVSVAQDYQRIFISLSVQNIVLYEGE